ncbi:MAG TPA: pantothenate kinase [Leptolyngbyaceae cyanobacterium M33_DOE_097]|uniref:Type III pantothenate kinase n=1 Tax=Oscillatoriales cyanobacterium SpSt-418 TaxID=2282169 RepID=A0A7C3PR75_9CYAN|nr:pantothenate kinase [Leptolyngbyaceae cyanobacterium M33_DOE_097]
MTGAQTWLALAIGNSRSHWAEFQGDQLVKHWDAPHLSEAESAPLPSHTPVDVWIASVVPPQSDRWRTYSRSRFITLEDIPLSGMYPTFGVDRALALWGAIQTIAAPVLVIDAGTALTFTGADADRRLVGGAIAPGLRLQLQALNQGTAALPEVLFATTDTDLPMQWATDTKGAIASGVFYTLLAGIQAFIADWHRQYPASPVVLTGGDGDRLAAALRSVAPELTPFLNVQPTLIFAGIQAVRSAILNRSRTGNP